MIMMMVVLMVISNNFFKCVPLFLNGACQEISFRAALVCDYELG